jgi:hypothetical protein
MYRLIFTFALVVMATGQVFGSAITGGPTSGANTLGSPGPDNGGTGVNGRLDSGTVAGPAGNDMTALAADLNVTAFALQRSFDISYELSNISFLDSLITGRVYDFTLTVTNALNSALGVPQTNESIAQAIQPIDIELIGGPGAMTFLDGPTNTLVSGSNSIGSAPSSTGTGAYTIFNSGRNLRFGGLNGGGLFIPNGSSEDFAFSVFIPHSGADFSLRITANPEPTSLILAGLGICVFGGGGYMRRRKRLQKNSEPSTDAVT